LIVVEINEPRGAELAAIHRMYRLRPLPGATVAAAPGVPALPPPASALTSAVSASRPDDSRQAEVRVAPSRQQHA
jgi:hypothetical protein